MFHVGKFDEALYAVPEGYAGHSRGYRRASLMDHRLGSVHMGAAVCVLEPHGDVARRMHANEKGIYILEGELEMKRGNEAFRLGRDDYALIPYGTPHAFRNTGSEPVRWFEMQAPQPKPPSGWQDTFFGRDNGWPEHVAALKINDAAQKSVGHFRPANPLVVQAQGIVGLAAYRFMDHAFGAQHFFMMRGELAVGGRRSEHDHPIEEFYFALSGESFMDIEGERFHLRPGDVAWTGVGARHAFVHTGAVPFRWIETQAPQFPAQQGTRNYSEWERLRRSEP